MGGAAVDDVFGATVEPGWVPASVPRPVIDRPGLQASADEAILAVPGVGRFHVRGGRRVVVAPAPGVEVADLGPWLHASVAALVLVQQGRFALHASSVRGGDRLVAVAGARGAGKSTTCSALAGRGHALVADDVAPVDLPPAGPPVVGASPRPLRLVPATATRLGYPPAPGSSGPLAAKWSYPIPPATGGRALAAVVVLRPSPDCVVAATARLGGADAIAALRANTFRPRLGVLRPEAHFRWLAALAAAVPVVELVRPVTGWTLDEVADRIEELVVDLGGEPVGGSA